MNLLKVMRIFVFVFAILFFSGFGNTANAQGGDGKTVIVTPTKTTSKTTSKKKPAKIIPKTTKTTKGKKTPDPPVGDWEMTNLYGRWEGTYNQGASTLYIDRVEGVNFYGNFTRGDFKIAFSGVVDRQKRTVTITETAVLIKKQNYDWNLGVNTGTLEYGGFGMKGTGKDGGSTTYTWSYMQMIGEP